MRVFVTVLAIAGIGALSSPGQSGNTSVSGKVDGPPGAPTARVELQSETFGPRVFRTISTASGEFRFAEVPEDRYTLTITRPGVVPAIVKSIQTVKGENRSIAALDLKEYPGCGGVIREGLRALPYSGRAFGALVGSVTAVARFSNAPRSLAGGDITATCADGNVCGRTTTDASGNFQFTALPAGLLTIRIKAAGLYDWQWSGFRVYADIETTYGSIDMVYRPKGILRGLLHPKPPRMVCD